MDAFLTGVVLRDSGSEFPFWYVDPIHYVHMSFRYFAGLVAGKEFVDYRHDPVAEP